MRLLIVTVHWDLVGGSERYAGAVVAGLGERGHQVGVLCARGEQGVEAELLPCVELDAPRLGGAARRRLAGLVRGFAPERILLLSRVSPDVLGVLLRSAPLVRFVQDHTLFCPGLNKLHEDGTACASSFGMECLRRYWLGGGCSGLKIAGLPSLRFPLRMLAACQRETSLTARADRVLVASEYMRRELLAVGFSPERVVVLPYFTRSATAHLKPAPLPAETRAFLEASPEPVLFAPARLTLPDKGVDFLLTALGKSKSASRLVVAGDGPAREWLEEKAREEGLADRVHFAGWRSPGEIESLYAAAALVVFPSVWNEPFGLVGLEAMAHEKPVVAFEVGGVPEWLAPGVTGLLCPRGDCDALARAIDELLADPARARAMGVAGRERQRERFSEAEHLDRLEATLGARDSRGNTEPGSNFPLAPGAG